MQGNTSFPKKGFAQSTHPCRNTDAVCTLQKFAVVLICKCGWTFKRWLDHSQLRKQLIVSATFHMSDHYDVIRTCHAHTLLVVAKNYFLLSLFVRRTHYCRHGLHANIVIYKTCISSTIDSKTVMTLNDIFVYIFSETGWIWTKLGRGMGSEKRVSLVKFTANSLHGPRRKRQNTNLFFCQEYHASYILVISALRISVGTWQKYMYVSCCPQESFPSEILIFSVKRSLPPKKVFFGRFWVPFIMSPGLQRRWYVFCTFSDSFCLAEDMPKICFLSQFRSVS